MKANTEAIYRVPQRSSIHYLRGLVANKKDKAEDEVWAMRESPSDFQYALEKRREELRTLSRKITHNDQAPYHPPFVEDICQQACRDVVFDAHRSLVMWDCYPRDLGDLEHLSDILRLEASSAK